MTEKAHPRSSLKRVRLLLWLLIGLALGGTASLLLIRSGSAGQDNSTPTAQSTLGGPFTLVGADGKPFSSAKLSDKPYAIYFGFTRCGDVCPTTLSRLVKLRRQAGGEDRLNIVFVTIDPTYDGPNQVGQYAELFNSPIIGLTGSPAQINRVKKQFGIYAQAQPNAPMGEQMAHSAIVLLFDRNGKFVATILPDEPNPSALDKLHKLVA